MQKYRIPVLALSLFMTLRVWVIYPLLTFFLHNDPDRQVSIWSDAYEHVFLGPFADWDYFQAIRTSSKINSVLSLISSYGLIVLSVLLLINFLHSLPNSSQVSRDSGISVPSKPQIPPGILD